MANRTVGVPAVDDNLPVPTILIVDDHVQVRVTARALLECDGFEVVGEAPTGVAGLDAAFRLKPDVVLLDVRLPDADGFALAERLTAGGAVSYTHLTLPTTPYV